MMRGFLGGALSGGVLGLGVAVVASAIAPPPQPPQVSDAAPGATQSPVEVNGSDAAGSEVDTAVQAGQSAAPAPAPDPDTLTALGQETRATAQAPQTGVASDLSTPAETAHAGGVALDGEEPVLPNPQALAPMAPQPADDVSISTQPAQPPQPQAEDVETAFEETEDAGTQTPLTDEPVRIVSDAPEASEAPGADETSQTIVTETPAAEDAPVTPEAVAESEAETPEAVVESETETPAVQETAEAPAPEDVVVAEAPEAPEATEPDVPDATNEAELAPVDPPATVAPETADAVEQETAEAAPADATPQEDDAPQVAMLAPTARPQIGTPAISLTDRDNGVTVNRLVPSAVPATDPADVTVISEAGAASPNQDPRPIARNGQPFANPDAKPLMSIVLIDNGASATAGQAGIAALRSFPYTLSFAVDSSLPDAAERVKLYKDAGFEVLAMIDLPPGAQATDAETTLGVTLAQLREVVGVLEGPAGSLQGSRAVSDQVTAILNQSGHGLVTQDKGLNTMPKLAVKEGVPAAPVFRDFDSKDQSATVIRRFLDQAAFKAGQEGAVIMLGRLRPDTISALLLWGLQDRAGQVALAPISAVLLNAVEDG
ncbi:MAG: divergent polysaccharide deacetylase family protein [Sulfitobacter sp.]